MRACALSIEYLLTLSFDIFLLDTGKPELTNGLPEAEAVSELAAGLNRINVTFC